MKKNLLRLAILSCLIPSYAISNDDVPEEDQVIELTNTDNVGSDENVLQVPVTATVNNSLLNVKFNGSVSLATVSVSNTLTGATINSQSLPAVSGTICKLPVSGLSTGTYTVSVTNEESGESVSGEFDVEE